MTLTLVALWSMYCGGENGSSDPRAERCAIGQVRGNHVASFAMGKMWMVNENRNHRLLLDICWVCWWMMMQFIEKEEQEVEQIWWWEWKIQGLFRAKLGLNISLDYVKLLIFNFWQLRMVILYATYNVVQCNTYWTSLGRYEISHCTCKS